MGTRKSIYFSNDLDEVLLDHVQSCGNFSSYVKRLILLDMERGITKVIPGRKEEREESVTKVIPEENHNTRYREESHTSNTQIEKEKTPRQSEPKRSFKPKQQGARIESKPKASQPMLNLIERKRRQINGK